MADRAACAPPRIGDHDDARGVHGRPARLLSEPRSSKPEISCDCPAPTSATNALIQRAEPYSATQRCTRRGPLSRGPLEDTRTRTAAVQKCVHVHRPLDIGRGTADVPRAHLRYEPLDLTPVSPRVECEDDVPDLWSCSSNESTPPSSPTKPGEARRSPSSRHFLHYATVDDTLLYHDLCLPQFRGRVNALRSLFSLSDEIREMARTADSFTALIYEQSLRIANH
jgi:hypothetical protein